MSFSSLVLKLFAGRERETRPRRKVARKRARGKLNRKSRATKRIPGAAARPIAECHPRVTTRRASEIDAVRRTSSRDSANGAPSVRTFRRSVVGRPGRPRRGSNQAAHHGSLYRELRSFIRPVLVNRLFFFFGFFIFLIPLSAVSPTAARYVHCYGPRSERRRGR